MVMQNKAVLGLDIGDYKASVETLVDLMGKKQAKAFRDSMNEAIKLNKVMGDQKLRMQGLTEAGNRAIVTFRKWGDDHRVLGVQVKNLTAAQRKQIKAQEDASFLHTKAGQAAIKTNKRVVISWQSVERVLLTYVIRRAFGALLRKMREAIDTTIEFNKRIIEIQTISQTMPETFDAWAESLRRVSNAWSLDLLDTANAAYQVLSNQVANTSAEVEAFLNTAGKFARVTRTSLEDSVNLLTATLNSYNMGADKAEEVSAKLFKTIELGRIRGTELANSFGRVTVIAAQMGVSLEELLASMATITIQGVKATETMTLLRGIFLKLAKPTEDMKEVYDKLGVASAEQMIFAEGLTGTLEALSEATAGTTTELAKLLGRIRPTTGAAALIKDLDNFNEVLNEIKENATLDYINAQMKLWTTSGEQLEKQLNELKNYFQATFGSRTARNILIISNMFGGLSNLIDNLISGLLAVGTAGGIAFSVRKVHNFIKAITAAKAAGTGLAGVIAPTAAGAGFIAIGAIALKIARDVQESQDKIAALKRELALLNAETNRFGGISTEAFEEAFIDAENLAKGLAGVVNGIREVTIAWERNLEDAVSKEAIKANEKLKDSTLDTIDGMLDALANYYHEVAKMSADTVKEIDKIKKEMRSFDEDSRDFIRQQEARYQTDKEQLAALKKEIGLARSVEDTTSKQKIENLERVLELQKEELKIYQDASKERAKEAERQANLGRSRGMPRAKIPEKMTDDIKKSMGNIKATMDAIRAEHKKVLEDQETQLKRLKDLTVQLEERRKEIFELLNKAEVAFGLSTTAYTKFEDTRVHQQILEAITTGKALKIDVGDFEQVLKDIADVQKFEKQQKQLTATQELNKNLNTNANSTIELIKSNNELVKVLNENIFNALQNLNAAFPDLQKSLDLFSEFAKEELVILGSRGIQGPEMPIEYITRHDASTQRLIKEFNKELEGLETATLEEQKEALKRAMEFGDEIQKNIISVGEQHNINVEELLDSFRVYIDKVEKAQGEVETIIASEERKKNLLEFGKAVQQVLQDTTDTHKGFREQIGVQADNIEAVIEVNNEYKKLTVELQRQYEDLIFQRNVLLSKSQGGRVTYASLGKRLGTDTVPAMLTPGEFVVNQFAAKRFFSRLVPMNYGLENPKFGNVNSTTIGDIHVSVTGGDSSNQTAISIAQELRRELRRGRVAI